MPNNTISPPSTQYAPMKLSIVIICWNDLKVTADCLRSIFDETHEIDFEVIVSDNGSTDKSVEYIREHFSQVQIVENKANLGYAKGNNAGIRVAKGEYVLILNPDTIIHDHALQKLVAFADCHCEAGAFGCRVLNPDGSFQDPARPIPTAFGYLIAALYLRWLGRFSDVFASDLYLGWEGQSERKIGYQTGCCILFRADVLRRLGGFDERFFYHCEEKDLCYRIWKSGSSVLFYPGAVITHLGGQSVGRFPIRFALETYRNGYRFFHKHYGRKGLVQIRRVYLLNLSIRFAGYKLLSLFRSSEALANRLKMYRVLIKWNLHLNPVRFIASGEEPDVGYEPLAPPPNMETVVGSLGKRD
jgi:GT2 family glycosyltransferase